MDQPPNPDAPQLPDSPRSGMTRRAFIKGVIASGAVASSAAYLFRSSGDTIFGQTSAPGSVERLITLNVNGQMRRVDVMKQETLAMTLRYKLGLTGTKIGCDRAECGACTVLIDDVPHYSCSVLTHTVRGRQVRTIEGLANGAGSCIPCSRRSSTSRASSARSACRASSMAAVGFLKTNPNPTRAGARARHLRQPLPLPGLRQDPHRAACAALNTCGGQRNG